MLVNVKLIGSPFLPYKSTIVELQGGDLVLKCPKHSFNTSTILEICTDEISFLGKVRRVEGEILEVGVSMIDMNGLLTLRRLSTRLPRCRIV